MVPSDSFLVLTLDAKQLLQKSNFLKSEIWKPILDQFRLEDAILQEVIDDKNGSGLDLNSPICFFARLIGSPHPTPVWGILASVDNEKKVNGLLSSLADRFELSPKIGKNLRLGNQNLPFEAGRRGKTAYLIGMLPNPRNPSTPDFEFQIDQLINDHFITNKTHAFPDSLKKHFAHKADLSFYLEGTGVSRLLEDFFVHDAIKQFLPVFDGLTHRPLGVHLQSSKGKLSVSAYDYSLDDNNSIFSGEKFASKNGFEIKKLLPGEAPLIGKINLEKRIFQTSVTSFFNSTMDLLSGGNFDSEKPLPGFGSTVSEMLEALSGNFVFAGGDLKINAHSRQTASTGIFGRFDSSFLLGAEKGDTFLAKQLLAGMRSSRALMALLTGSGLNLVETDNMIWLSSNDYRKEIEAGKPVYPLSKNREINFDRPGFMLDFNFTSFTQSARKEEGLFFEENKNLQLLDQFSNLLISARKNKLKFQLNLHESGLQGFRVLVDSLGQSIIDNRNEDIYRAISQNDFEGLTRAVAQGALINANDYFGHTPLHYCAYKGNARFVDYLLRNGGNPNVQGRHMSTPLHSAAWGRNREVFELLLEDGADVNARTDEGETPGMTAALRGEKEMLEILFALSADPHACDQHGSNMLDLAAAGGHQEIVDLLLELGVSQNHPLHVAAGLGKIDLVKKLLEQGYKVNQPDAFGATPLLIAVVSGKIDMVEFLLSKGADPKISAKDGYTLMHGAAFSGIKEMVKLAISFGLEINPRYGPEGITPVDVAEDEKEALPYLRSFGGRASWELAPIRR